MIFLNYDQVYPDRNWFFASMNVLTIGWFIVPYSYWSWEIRRFPGSLTKKEPQQKVESFVKVSPFRWDPRTSKVRIRMIMIWKHIKIILMVTVTGWLGFWISMCVFLVFFWTSSFIFWRKLEMLPPQKGPAAKHCFLSLFNYTVPQRLRVSKFRTSRTIAGHNKKRVWPPLFAPVGGSWVTISQVKHPSKKEDGWRLGTWIFLHEDFVSWVCYVELLEGLDWRMI